MTRALQVVVFGVLLLLAACAQQVPSELDAAAVPTDLFFSEYIEGSSNNKALELYNGTGAAIDLAAGAYNVQLFFNGATTAAQTISLMGTVAATDVFVLASSSATASILVTADQTSGVPFFNGDDAIVLRKGTTVLDVIGQIGVDPGTEWGSGLVSTADNTLRRKGTVAGGDTNGSDPFDPAGEWDGFAIDTFDGLGTFSSTPGEEPTPVCATAPAVTKISTIQGSGETIPCPAQTVVLEGVVVGDYEGPSPALRGFYLQEEPGDQDADPATSEGIFVFNGNNESVALGQTVSVTGTVSEFQGQTQVSAQSVSVTRTDPVALSPTPVSLPLASAAALEAVEGMYVTFPQTLMVTELFQLGRFGQVLLSSGGRLPQPTSVTAPGSAAASVQAANDLNQILIDDASQAQNPDPILFGRGGQPLSAGNTLRGGDTVTNLTGVLTYTWGGNSASPNAYRVRPVGDLSDLAGDSDVPVFEATNPRPTASPAVGGNLRVASFNVLNYFLTLDDGGPDCGPDGFEQECRGAENSEELERQQAKLTAALSALDADIFGLIELENTPDPDVEPLADIVERLNAVSGADTYDYVVTGTIGTDAIKVGLIYKVATVTPVGTPLIDTNPVHNRPPLAQLFEDRDGARFSVVVNHFKSKGCDGASGADSDGGDGQGCFNATRTAQAEALRDFIGTSVTPLDPDVLIIGDLNAYAKEDPVRTLEAAGFSNQTERFGGEDAYGYVFDGQWGYLDHALASSTLAEQVTGTADFHINADEPSVLDYNTNFKSAGQVSGLYAPDAYRTSDHDPVVVGLELDAPEQDPEALLDALQAKVRQLYYDRELSRARTVVLLAPLELAEIQLDRGRENRAERSLRTFEELVRLYRDRRYLEAATAQDLRDDSVAIRELL